MQYLNLTKEFGFKEFNLNQMIYCLWKIYRNNTRNYKKMS